MVLIYANGLICRLTQVQLRRDGGTAESKKLGEQFMKHSCLEELGVATEKVVTQPNKNFWHKQFWQTAICGICYHLRWQCSKLG